MKDALIITALSVVPQRLGARMNGWFARLPVSSAVHHAVIRWYCKRYKVAMDDFVGTVEDYPTLAQFFVRALREGKRPIDPTPGVLVSPADARAAAFGSLNGHQLPDDAGMKLNIKDMLDDDRYEDGEYAVLYLSPRDYHRVHHPIEGHILGYRYLPGRLWPVFPAATKKVENLFAVNERLVARIATQSAGEIAVVLVGAYGVGRMTASFSDIVTNTSDQGAEAREFEAPIPVARGEELGRFNLGSTVVLVAEKGKVAWDLPKGEMVEVGQAIARIL